MSIEDYEPLGEDWQEALQTQLTQLQQRIDVLSGQVESLQYGIQVLTQRLSAHIQSNYKGSSEQAKDTLMAPYYYARRRQK